MPWVLVTATVPGIFEVLRGEGADTKMEEKC